MEILLITPPFTQLNTPYPATAYIKGYLKTIDQRSTQMDLGIETILQVFSKQGLHEMFDQVNISGGGYSENSQRIYALREEYISTIDSVIHFLQDQDPTLSHLICERNFLPEASKFTQLEELDWAFGTMGIRDQARHLATLYLEDIGDFISEVVDPHFGFSRYAERISLSAKSFDALYSALAIETSYIASVMLDILERKVKQVRPDLVCLSVPFPGNLFAALKCGQWLKQHHPDINIVMGGGYPNTELRSVSEERVFEFVDYITLDDGETPLRNLIEHLSGKRDVSMLKRTFLLQDGKVCYISGSLESDVKQEKVGTPSYEGLDLKKYLSVIQLTNPMHRLWSDGRWNKLTMAHGCYWGKCTFCDISLDYIKNYEASSASTIVDRMEQLIDETGERGFHFVDEAAPPALMKAVAIEIVRRRLVVTWWTNIRFEKSFHFDLCRLLAASGCIAVSGGLEVASDRLLALIDKGVTIEQVTKVTDSFTRAGIMVHAYLMYGFPTQTDQETIDSLEVVRQLFMAGVIQSGFWHRFAMTAHSPVGMAPHKFKVAAADDSHGTFANNDLEHEDPSGGRHALFSGGLKKSLYNYMHGVCLEHPLQNWFENEVPATTHPAGLINGYLTQPTRRETKPSDRIMWIGGPITLEIKSENAARLIVHNKNSTHHLTCTTAEGTWISSIIKEMKFPITMEEMKHKYSLSTIDDFSLFWFGDLMEEMKNLGLLII